MSRQDDYIDEVRFEAKNIWFGIQRLAGELQSEWNANDYGNTLPEDGDGTYSRAEVGAVVFDAANALKDILNGTLDPADLPGAQAGNIAALL